VQEYESQIKQEKASAMSQINELTEEKLRLANEKAQV
jgi:hypothetical protein